MLAPNNADRKKNQDEQQLSISDRSTHDEKYPFLSEFSGLIANMSTNEMEKDYLRLDQKNFAKALWEAENYGGSKMKCEKRLKEIYGSKWYEMTTIKENMSDIREYYELVLIIDHKLQWDKCEKLANIA